MSTLEWCYLAGMTVQIVLTFGVFELAARQGAADAHKLEQQQAGGTVA